MKHIKQWANHKLLKKLLAGVLTFAIILTMFLFTENTAFAGSSYNINTADVATLQSRLSSIATVSENDGIITITLIMNVDGMILFEGPVGTTYVLDAAGNTINGSGQNEAVQLANDNNATVKLKGNGTYQGGINNTVYVGRGKLIIESGTFNATGISGNRLINGTVSFNLAEGYDYYTVTTNAGNLFASQNRKEKSHSSITLDKEQLIVSQCHGDVPLYQIDALPSTNGSYDIQVNGAAGNSAKVDDTVTVTFNPNTNYRFSSMVINKTNPESNYRSISGGSMLSYDFDMIDSDVSIDVGFVWHNQIMTQPTQEKPTVVTNNPDGVSSYQWYTTSIVNSPVVDGPAGAGEVSVDFNFSDGMYNPTTKIWSADGYLDLYLMNLSFGDQLIISEITGNVMHCNGVLQDDGSYIHTYPSYNVHISFLNPGGSCKITLRRTVEAAVEGQTSDTYTGPEDNVYAKVNFTNGDSLISNTIAYEEVPPVKHIVTVNNGTAAETSYEAGATVSIRANPPEAGKQFKEWTVESGGVTLANGTSDSTTFTMPEEAVVVTAVYEDIPTPTPVPTASPAPTPSPTPVPTPSPGPTVSPTPVPTSQPTPGYSITSGANGIYQIGSGGTLTVSCSGLLDELTGIFVDGSLLDSSNYTLKSGSTVLTLEAAYLNGLSIGVHTLVFEYGAEVVQTSFQIKAADSGTTDPEPTDTDTEPSSGNEDIPKTGDHTPVMWFVALAMISGAGILYLGRKKSFEK